MRLSKSKFTQGLGCHRALWWSVHEPDAPEREVGPALQAIFDQGTRVGELAREHVPGGHLIDFPYTESEKRMRPRARRSPAAPGSSTRRRFARTTSSWPSTSCTAQARGVAGR